MALNPQNGYNMKGNSIKIAVSILGFLLSLLVILVIFGAVMECITIGTINYWMIGIFLLVVDGAITIVWIKLLVDLIKQIIE